MDFHGSTYKFQCWKTNFSHFCKSIKKNNVIFAMRLNATVFIKYAMLQSFEI